MLRRFTISVEGEPYLDLQSGPTGETRGEGSRGADCPSKVIAVVINVIDVLSLHVFHISSSSSSAECRLFGLSNDPSISGAHSLSPTSMSKRL